MKDFKNRGVTLLISVFFCLALVIGLFFLPGEIKAGREGSRENKALMDRGKRLVEKFNCAVCHKISGHRAEVKTKVGPSLANEGSKVRKGWLVNFLKKPELIRPASPYRMPNLRLSSEDALALAEYLARTQVNPEIRADIFQDGEDLSSLVNEGRSLIDKELGCKTCHRIGKEGAWGGPDLSKVGRRLRSGWVFQFIKAPQRLQPKTPMPGVPLSEREARAITAYLMSLR